ncbi:MFS transporter [Infirmifilum sp. NZ]|uniref:MFS transporter n=1 Tax=Infirmifilum sp. NZ TaxID=2926850 RepID=UPI00279BAEAC|nr:MFS transporter [Infirmifilum sp. NZ]UNQ73706.1 MFS transporter [Infirmifilum sp. NZ]
MRLRNITLIAVARSSQMFVLGFLTWYLPITIEESLGLPTLGLTYSASCALSGFAGLVGGALSDSLGRRPVIVAGSAAMLLGALLVALAPLCGAGALALSALLLFGLQHLGDAAMDSALYESAEEDSLGRALAAVFVAGALSGSAGSAVLGFTAERDVALVGALVLAVALTCFASSALLEETAQGRGALSVRGSGERVAEWFKSMGSVPLAVLSLTVLMAVEVDSTLNLYPVFMKDVQGFAEREVGLVYGAIPVMQALIYPLAGSAVDKLGAPRAACAVLLIQSAGVAGFAALGRPYAALALLAASGAGAVFNIAYRAMVVSSASASARGTTVALVYVVWDLATVPAPALGAMLYTLDPRLPFFLASLTLGLVAIIALSAYHRPVN